MEFLNQLVGAGGSLWIPGAFFQEVSLHVCICVCVCIRVCLHVSRFVILLAKFML